MSHRETESELESWLRRELRAGFDSEERLAERAANDFSDIHVDPERLEVIFHAWRAEQARWPERTDCDRLDDAFTDLEAHGVLARQNFSCCQTCGFSEIDDEVEEAESKGQTVDGFVFFHQQDTDHAAANGHLMLRFSDLGAAKRATEALGRAGLAWQWSGEVSRCIEISLDWKRRPRTAASGARRFDEAWAAAYVVGRPREVARTRAALHGEALVAAGETERAVRWCRARNDASANASVAAALARRGDVARAKELMLAGLRMQPPFDRWLRGNDRLDAARDTVLSYVDLFVRCGLTDEDVIGLAGRRIDNIPKGGLGWAAVRAWFFCALRAAKVPLNEGYVEEVRKEWDEPVPDVMFASGVRRVLGAALWELGVLDGASALGEDGTFEWGERKGIVARALVRAAVARGETAVLPTEGELHDVLVPHLLRALPLPEACALAKTMPWYRQREAWVIVSERAPELRVRALPWADDREMQYLEGVITFEENEQQQLEDVLSLGAIDRSLAREQLKVLTAAPPQGDEKPPELPSADRLAKWLAKLVEQQGTIYKQRTPARRLLEAAKVMAQRGDAAAAAELYGQVLRLCDHSRLYLWDEEVALLAALGRLDEALEIDREWPGNPCVAPLALALVKAGRKEEAIERVTAALERPHEGTLLALAPVLEHLGADVVVVERAKRAAQAEIDFFSRPSLEQGLSPSARE